ncbi:alkaline phosphatase family protein [Actinocrispum wychmicini]|uniref:Putative AlkP superfamily pyrophosphatase or phosphodiesterase n=1 Tax=Actinocrispum wychmicini TaxID=1213861 RepID=A0A4R2JTH5_9PSEU|nr:alkaline phosphatase family protein [Actinocrispum wychmicini]TCO62437.1 putative AlkP superfamily pyrophosphatase or phosphodiesterase [Actinocrispum wychmicini]
MLVPRYGSGALSDVVPSLLAGLDVPGMVNTLSLPAARKVCLLLVDGLGWELLQRYAADAPFLAGLAGGSITAGFPATTGTSLAAIGTGVPSGEHGVVGYTFAAAPDQLINVLRWTSHASGKHVDLRDRFVPEEFQPLPTTFERAQEAGVLVRLVTEAAFEGSGLTRAVLRGGEFAGVLALGDLAAKAATALTAADRVFCYAYHSQLDLLGHVYGPGSAAWRFQLGHVDRLAAAIASDLPPDAMLVVTADHGMVLVGKDDKADFDTTPELQDGVRMLAGEPRVRHIYVEDNALDDVLTTWRAHLGDRAQVVPREEAIEAGWFGPRVLDRVRARIGDIVVATTGTAVVVRSGVEPMFTQMAGQHGSLTATEQLIPLLTLTS